MIYGTGEQINNEERKNLRNWKVKNGLKTRKNLMIALKRSIRNVHLPKISSKCLNISYLEHILLGKYFSIQKNIIKNYKEELDNPWINLTSELLFKEINSVFDE